VNNALAIPGHLGGAWNSLEYVLVSPVTGGEVSSVGEHVQGTDEIYFMHRGTGLLTTNGVTSPVGPGFLVIAPKGTRHTIKNTSSDGPLGFLVIELKTPAGGPAYPPSSIESLPSLLRESDDFHPARVEGQRFRLWVASVDLSSYFSAPWGRLSLVEVPAGGSVDEYVETLHDEDLFVVGGQATIRVANERFDSDEHGLNVVVPRGVPHGIANRSSADILTILSVLVRAQEANAAS
jgi:mannose-6-phosphate isomerase-like protein (cupin superfamily)